MQTNAAMPTNEKKTAADITASPVTRGFKVSGVFSSHMVIQRDREINVWGFSDEDGDTVTGEFDGETASSVVKDGRFSLTFSARKASHEPKTMTVRDGRGRETVFEDILTGDVWVIGGQSNGELNLRFCAPETIPAVFDERRELRLFMQTQAYPYQHQELCSCPQADVVNPDWRWRLPDAESCLSFSALGYFTGEELMLKTGIPTGVINISAGGACIRELIPAELARELGYDYGANVPQCGYYNTLINPFIGLKFKGMVFFQGESEGCVRELSERYRRELCRLVEDERERFGFDFPFCSVQISSYRKEGKQYFPFLETVRLEQFDALSRIPDSSLTVSMDLGSPDDWGDFAHSPYKKALADRVSALILAKYYGTGSLSDAESPKPVSAVMSGGYVYVRFSDVSRGLESRSGGAGVNGFSFGTIDAQIPAAADIISADTVRVKIPDGADPSYLNYAYYSEITCENAQLIKRGGLPCPAFRIKVTE